MGEGDHSKDKTTFNKFLMGKTQFNEHRQLIFPPHHL
jgi:hypothetical protein